MEKQATKITKEPKIPLKKKKKEMSMKIYKKYLIEKSW